VEIAPGAEDVELGFGNGAVGPLRFAQSRRGQGLLTLHPGYQCRTEGEEGLWVRGPLQAPKDGIYPLESLVDTSVLPGTILIDWQFTRAGQTIRFAAGEPFCTILPNGCPGNPRSPTLCRRWGAASWPCAARP
jgi:Family of unknown function (DUF6065)